MPIKDKQGSVVQILESSTDITQRKELETARDKAMQELKALKNQLEEENLQLKEDLLLNKDFEEIVGQSNAILYVLERVKQVAETDATVLIQGETGVGKELIAGAIHRASQRAAKPFIRVNCATLTPSLIESELFGHEAGAFTGADRRRKGRFEMADGGTLLLDEISELPLELQASCYGCSRKVSSSGSAAAQRTLSMCGLSPLPTASCRMNWKMAVFGPTCFTASRFTPSPCRRCENIGRISNCWCGTF